MKKENTQARLAYIMKNQNLKQKDILDKCEPYCIKYGVKLSKSDLSQYVNGKTEPSQDKLVILGIALNVSEAWLMGFDVPMERQSSIYNENMQSTLLSSAETDLITKYRTLDNYGKNTVNVVVDSEHTRCASDTDTKVIKVIPLADFSLSAGTGMELLDNTYDMIEIDGSKYGKADIAFTVKGDSMHPKYNNGDIVYIRRQPSVDINDIGAFLYNGKQYIKKLIFADGAYKLHSLNPNYEDIAIKDELITYGKVLN